jgi:hypothetical protein
MEKSRVSALARYFATIDKHVLGIGSTYLPLPLVLHRRMEEHIDVALRDAAFDTHGTCARS